MSVPPAVDRTPAMSYRSETLVPVGKLSPTHAPNRLKQRKGVLRVVTLWGYMHILTLNHRPVGEESYPTIDDAIRHAEHEWGPVRNAVRVSVGA